MGKILQCLGDVQGIHSFARDGQAMKCYIIDDDDDDG